MKTDKIKINYFLVIIVMILATVQVFLLNRYSTAGNTITTLTTKIKEIEQENDRLSQQIASVSAMTSITSRAERLNLTSVMASFSLTKPLSIAFGNGSSL